MKYKLKEPATTIEISSKRGCPTYFATVCITLNIYASPQEYQLNRRRIEKKIKEKFKELDKKAITVVHNRSIYNTCEVPKYIVIEHTGLRELKKSKHWSEKIYQELTFYILPDIYNILKEHKLI